MTCTILSMPMMKTMKYQKKRLPPSPGHTDARLQDQVPSALQSPETGRRTHPGKQARHLLPVRVKPENHPVTMEGIDVLIGGEGKHVSVPGFRRKEFRGKLAIAITANFTNKRTTAEAIVDEISGVAFVYKQDFFNNLYDEFGIALENIVYYKDDTHYFVMTTKKHSLLDRKVLKQDLPDPIALLSQKNINKDALYEYIRDACDYCTDYQLPHLDFALNHHGFCR